MAADNARNSVNRGGQAARLSSSARHQQVYGDVTLLAQRRMRREVGDFGRAPAPYYGIYRISTNHRNIGARNQARNVRNAGVNQRRDERASVLRN